MTLFASIQANIGCARIIIRHLASSGGRAPEDETMRAIVPAGLRGPDDRTGNALTETVDVLAALALVRRDRGDLVLEADDRGVDLHTTAGFRTVARRALFAVAGDTDPSEGGMAAVAGALAWLLAQEPLVPLGRWGHDQPGLADPARLQEAQLGYSGGFFGTDRPWGVFARWAPSLGLAEVVAGRSRAITGDPTRAVRDELAHVPSGPAAEVVAALAARLPVVDGGAIRRQVDERWREPPPQPLSPSLSHALVRLERAGAVALPAASDAPAAERVVLHLGPDTRTIARIEVTP